MKYTDKQENFSFFLFLGQQAEFLTVYFFFFIREIVYQFH